MIQRVVLFELQGTRRVGPSAQDAIERATKLAFSVVSFAEIGIKAAIGKLTVPDDLGDHITQTGCGSLAWPRTTGSVADLPMHHRDPFDRLLISQARREGLAIVTADERIAPYEVETIDADA